MRLFTGGKILKIVAAPVGLFRLVNVAFTDGSRDWLAGAYRTSAGYTPRQAVLPLHARTQRCALVCH
jgi:hypothetical protein